MTGDVDRLAVLLGTEIVRAAPVSGGDLSTVLRLRLTDGRAAIAKIGALVGREAEMLRAIGGTGAPVPEVIAAAGDLLVMTELASDGSVSGVWESLGEALRLLHAPREGDYGWGVDYAFGPVAIPNGRRADWAGFWADNRLRCHLPHLAPDLARRVEQLADAMGDLLPERPTPALLHGDLWGGNVLASGSTVTGLIDPACYLGDREVDVAMLTLFDAPPARFFDALDLARGWRERLAVYRLWPLLVHVRLFGGGYAARVAAELAAVGF